MDKNTIINKVNVLLGNAQNRLLKYQNSYSLYSQSPISDLRAQNPQTPGVIGDISDEDYIIPKLNVIKSCVDAVTSKISTSHVRPYCNAIKGSFKTIQICKQLQIFFDYYFDEFNLYNMCTTALRNACIFDQCHIYIEPETMEPKLIMPWNLYTMQNEQVKKTCYVEFYNNSVESVPDYIYNILTAAEKKQNYITYGIYINTKEHEKAYFINRQYRKKEKYEHDIIPVATIKYTEPVVGNNSLSIPDMLCGIQIEVDELMKRIAKASRKNPGMTIAIPNASNIAVGELNNEIGNIIQYNTAGSDQPVSVMTPAFISEQYMSLLDDLIEKAYNLVGISQLTAQGKKTPGLDSGIALATQEDIESDRFQSVLTSYIQLYTTVAKIIVQIATDDDSIMKPSRYDLKLTWKDVREDYGKMRLEFSAADSLSKDPSEKLKQLQALATAGIIPATQIASLLEIPDINRGYSAANNGFNCTQSIIDACIYDDKYEIPDYVPIEMVKEQVVNMQLSLRAAEGATDSNEDDIAKLNRLFQVAIEKEQELNPIQDQVMAQDVNTNNAFTQIDGATNADADMKAIPYQTAMSGNGNSAASAEMIS